MKKILLIWTLFLIILNSLFIILPSANALTLQSPEYNLRILPRQKIPPTTPLPIPTKIPDSPPKLQVGGRYVGLKVSETQIDFGELRATTPVKRQTILEIKGNANLYALEDHALQTEAGNIIPDTSCDNGNCAAGQKASWESVLAYGFGFRVDRDTSFFQPFANQAQNQNLHFITTAWDKSNFPLTFKTNISATQEIGQYQNTLRFVLVPNY